MQAVALANRLTYVIGEPYVVNERVLRLDCSIGIALAPPHGATLRDLLASADLALSSAKKDGGGMVRLFEPHLKHRADARPYQQ